MDCATSTPTLSREGFARLSVFVTNQLGIKMPEAKLSMLQSRLQRRVRQLGLSTLDSYCEYLFNPTNTQEEIVHFIDLVTTNKTDFLREPQHFDYLTRAALPAMTAAGRGGDWHCKVWCAGCSSGEEPYTLAMVLDQFGAERRGFHYSILATDISTRKLTEASNGIYEEFKIEPVPESWRRKYMLRSADPARKLVRVIPELRSRITFHRLNFMDPDYKVRERFEAIFFRNVMIYFDRPTQEAVVNKLCRSLRPGGYLFIGHSESLAGLNVPVRSVSAAVYRMAS